MCKYKKNNAINLKILYIYNCLFKINENTKKKLFLKWPSFVFDSCAFPVKQRSDFSGAMYDKQCKFVMTVEPWWKIYALKY